MPDILILQSSPNGIVFVQRMLTKGGFAEHLDYKLGRQYEVFEPFVISGRRQLLLAATLSGSMTGVLEKIQFLRNMNHKLLCLWHSTAPFPGKPLDGVVPPGFRAQSKPHFIDAIVKFKEGVFPIPKHKGVSTKHATS